MKNISLITILFSFLALSSISAQDVCVYKMIGKHLDAVVAKYGKPDHKDNSNPSMTCFFYKTKSYNLVFVSDKSAVYQAEGSKSFKSKSKAESEMYKVLTNCRNEGITIDTIATGKYSLFTTGIRMKFTLFENKFSKKFEVKIKANKSES